MKLTETRLEKLERPAKGKDKLVKDDVQPGLFVRVSSKGSKTYLCQYTFAGVKEREPIRATTLATARTAAAKIMGEVALGRNPAADRKAATLAAKVKAAHVELTLGALVDQWAALSLASKRERYSTEATRAIKRGFARHLALPAAALTRADVVAVLDAIAADHPTMARQTAAYGRAAFGWAMKRGSLTTSPFVNMDLPATVRRDRVLSDLELRAIWQATAKPGSFNAIVRVLLLTGARREEVAGLTWAELSADGLVWTLPEARAKNGVAHQVPLSPQVRAIIEAAPRYANKFVFPGAGGSFNGWGRSKDKLDEASGVAGWRLHDIRRSVATNLQKLGVKLETTESILNHISGSRGGITGIYQRYDFASEKAAALQLGAITFKRSWKAARRARTSSPCG